MNRLEQFRRRGQGIWLDYLSRALIDSGELARLVSEGVTGVTSNPAILAEVVARNEDYLDDIARLGAARFSHRRIMELLAVEDIRDAADELAAVHAASDGADGYVGLEISPIVAHDREATIAEAERLFRAVDRPNLMVKVPATRAGLAAVTELIARGVHVNVTLLFGVGRYLEAVEAWMRGLERRLAAGDSLAGSASVASIFVGRLDLRLSRCGVALARRVSALAVARRIHHEYQTWQATPRWRALVRAGARPQRLVWAGMGNELTGRDALGYVEPLALPGTVATLPLALLNELRRRGVMRGEEDDADASAEGAEALRAADCRDLESLAAELEAEGVAQLASAECALLELIAAGAGMRPASEEKTAATGEAGCPAVYWSPMAGARGSFAPRSVPAPQR